MGKFDKTNKTARSFFFLGLCIVCWGLIPVVTKQILGELNNLQMLFFEYKLSCFFHLKEELSPRSCQTHSEVNLSDGVASAARLQNRT